MASLDRCDEPSTFLLHASAVRLGDKGVLLMGTSGSGKSDLALQLIDRGAVLIADDQVRISTVDGRLRAEPPAKLAGLIEVRDLGILRLAHAVGFLDLVVELERGKVEERLPTPHRRAWHGISLPVIRIDSRAPSAAAKIRLALWAERVA